jgi:hypothetical protein
MPYQRYSIKEALNRFYRLWSNDPPPSDAPNSLPGDLFSEDEAWSNIAELFAGSLPGVTFSIPAVLGTAIAAQQAHRYGGIYVATGTATQALTTSWAKITGSFQNNMVSSSYITPEYEFDHLYVTEVGVYFVNMQLSFSGAANAYYNCAVYKNGVREEQIRFRRRLNANGDVGSASAHGLVNITGSPAALEIYAMSDGSNNFTIEAGQFTIFKAYV